MGISNVTNTYNNSLLDYLNSDHTTTSSSSDTQDSLLSVLSTGSDDDDSSGDLFQLSPAAQLAVSRAEDILNSNDTLNSLKLTASTSLSSLKNDIAAAFEENGINTTQEIDLALDSKGNVIVTNDNPQADAIEKLFAGNSRLKTAFTKCIEANQTAGSAEESNTFQTAYNKNAALAMKNYAYLFDTSSDATTSLTIKDGVYETVYNRFGQESIIVSKIGA